MAAEVLMVMERRDPDVLYLVVTELVTHNSLAGSASGLASI